jgi:hypothetical protein
VDEEEKLISGAQIISIIAEIGIVAFAFWVMSMLI